MTVDEVNAVLAQGGEQRCPGRRHGAVPQAVGDEDDQIAARESARRVGKHDDEQQCRKTFAAMQQATAQAPAGVHLPPVV